MMFRFLVLLLMNELLLCMVESKGNIHYYDFLVSTNYFSSCFSFFSFILLGMVMGQVQNGIRYPKKLLHLVNNKNVLLLLLFLFLLHFIRNDNGTDLKQDHTRKNFFTLLITRMIFFFFFILLGMTMRWVRNGIRYPKKLLHLFNNKNDSETSLRRDGYLVSNSNEANLGWDENPKKPDPLHPYFLLFFVLNFLN